MSLVTLEEAASRLPELVQEMNHGEEIVLTQNDIPVARLVLPLPKRPRPHRGSHKGQVLYVAPDIDDIPKGFEDYL